MAERARIISLRVAGAAFLGLLFYAYLHYSETGQLPSWETNRLPMATSLLSGVLIGGIIFLLNKRLDRSLSWRHKFATRFLVGYLVDGIISFVFVIGVVFIAERLSGQSSFWRPLNVNDPDVLWKTGILLSTVMFIYNVVYALLFSYQHYMIAEIDALRYERRQLELQFEALRSQISPHYLFNSLNTISSLLYQDTRSAEAFIRKLAETYQYILSTQHTNHVPVRDEIQFVRSYFFLLRIRFQLQLSLEIDLQPETMSSVIPPLTLQMLVENAIKHNELSGSNMLFIYITAADNRYIKVINTKTGTVQREDSLKVGLDNIRSRYSYFTDKKITIRDEDNFTVSLPVLDPSQIKSPSRFQAA